MLQRSDIITARQLLHDRDLHGIQTLLSGLSERETPYTVKRWFRVRILANEDYETTRWFWFSVLGDRLDDTVAKMVRTIIQIIHNGEFEEGHHYSLGEDVDGQPVIYMTAEARHFLLDQLPVERHGSANSLLRTYDSRSDNMPEPGRGKRSTMGGK